MWFAVQGSSLPLLVLLGCVIVALVAASSKPTEEDELTVEDIELDADVTEVEEDAEDVMETDDNTMDDYLEEDEKEDDFRHPWRRARYGNLLREMLRRRYGLQKRPVRPFRPVRRPPTTVAKPLFKKILFPGQTLKIRAGGSRKYVFMVMGVAYPVDGDKSTPPPTVRRVPRCA